LETSLLALVSIIQQEKGERKYVLKRKLSTMLLLLAMLMFLGAFAATIAMAEGTTPTIRTDKQDYSPAETVTIYGSGFNPEATVSITVARPDSSSDEWTVTSDSSGSFTTTYLLDGITGTYTVNATDGTNTATTTFTDSTITIRVNRDTPTAASFNTASESTFSVKFRVDNDNTAGDASRTISGTYTLTFSGLSLVSGPSSSGTFSGLAKGSPIYYEWTFKAPIGPATGSITLSVAITSVSPSRDFGPGDKTSDSISYTVNVLAPPTVSITVTSSPAGSGFVKVDNTAYTTPHTFSWTVGDTHTLEALSPVSGGTGIQYVWTSWSDGGAQMHDYVVPSSSATVTANYQTQYYISVTSAHGSPTQSSQWVNAGSDFTVSVTTPEVVVADEHQWVLTGLTVDGTPQAVSDTVSFNDVDAAHSVAFSWTEQWYITVVSAKDSPTASAWVNAGDDFTASVTSPVADGVSHQWVCTGHTIDEGSPESGVSHTFEDVAAAHTIVFNWQEQYYLTVNTSPPGLDSPTGEDWYDTGVTAHVSTAQYVDIAPGSSRYRFSSWTGATGTYADATVVMDSAKTATANYIVQYKLTVASAQDSPSPSVGDHWYDTGTHIDASVTSPADESDGTRYRCTGWTGTGSVPSSGSTLSFHFDITAPSTLTWNWIAQYKLTFAQTGLDSDATGTVVTIGEVAKTFTDLPITDVWYDSGTTYSYEDIVSGGSGKRFVKTGVTGPSSPISTSGTVTGNYHTEYYVTFGQTGLSSDATGTVVTVGGSGKAFGDLPYADWVDSGTVYAYTDPVPTGDANKRYKLINVDGSASPISTSGTVTGNYKTQYQVTFTQTGLTDATGTVVTIGGSAKTKGDLPLTDWFDSGTTYSYEDVVASLTADKRFKLIDVTGPTSPITASGTVTGNYIAQYKVIFTESGLDGTATGIVVTVDGSTKTYAELPFTTDWLDHGFSLNFEYADIIDTSVSGKRFKLESVSHTSPLTVTIPTTVTGTYKTQYHLAVKTDPAGLVTIPGEDWYDECTYVDLEAPATVPVSTGVQYRFDYWDVDGTPVEGNPIEVHMDAAHTATAHYVQQYYLTVTSPYNEPTPKSDWFDAGTEITASVTSPWPVDAVGTRYVCTGWTGTGSVPASGTESSVKFTINAPSSITWNWKTQYEITVTASPDGALGGTFEVTYTSCGTTYTNVEKTTKWTVWVDAGTTVTVSEPQEYVPSEEGVDGVRYEFDSYSPSDSVDMTEAKTITLAYKTQYYLTVISPYDTPGGEDWYYEGETAYATLVDGFVAPNIGFVGWSEDASGLDLLSDPITMDTAKTAIAKWEASLAYGDVRTIGFWKHQVNVWYFTELVNGGMKIKGIGTAQVSQTDLMGYLKFISDNSGYAKFTAIWVEGNKLKTLENAYKILTTPTGPNSMKMRAEQQLLGVWLNLARKAFFWNTELSQSSEYIYVTYGLKDIGEAIKFCEAELTKPEGNFQAAKGICDSINNNLGVVWGT